jgi:hypothetical protein
MTLKIKNYSLYDFPLFFASVYSIFHCHLDLKNLRFPNRGESIYAFHAAKQFI